MKFRIGSDSVEAVKFNGSSTHKGQIECWMSGELGWVPEGDGIHTRDITSIHFNEYHVIPGDWVVQFPSGEFKAFSSDDFNKQFKPWWSE